MVKFDQNLTQVDSHFTVAFGPSSRTLARGLDGFEILLWFASARSFTSSIYPPILDNVTIF